MNELITITSTVDAIHACDFCEAPAKFTRMVHEGGFWNLSGLEGAGSDHLAIWCGACGPAHML